MRNELRKEARQSVLPERLKKIDLLFRGVTLHGEAENVSVHGIAVRVSEPSNAPFKSENIVISFPDGDMALQGICVYVENSGSEARIGLFVHQPYDQAFLSGHLQSSLSSAG